MKGELTEKDVPKNWVGSPLERDGRGLCIGRHEKNMRLPRLMGPERKGIRGAPQKEEDGPKNPTRVLST